MQLLPAWRSEPIWLLAGLGVIPALIVWYQPEIALGSFVLVLATLFLIQTLVRDLVIYWQLRNGGHADNRKGQCFCLETPVGVLLLGIAISVYWTSPQHQNQVPWWIVVLGVGATLWVNFLMRDLVIRWRPFAIRRDPSHFNIIPRF